MLISKKCSTTIKRMDLKEDIADADACAGQVFQFDQNGKMHTDANRYSNVAIAARCVACERLKIS